MVWEEEDARGSNEQQADSMSDLATDCVCRPPSAPGWGDCRGWTTELPTPLIGRKWPQASSIAVDAKWVGGSYGASPS